MTCAIGLIASDGILLCADQRFSGVAISHDDKIFSIPLCHGHVEIAIAGCEATALVAVEACRAKLLALPHRKRSVYQICELLSAPIKRIYEREIFAIDDSFARSEAGFELLVAIAAVHPTSGCIETQLYVMAAGWTLSPVRGFRCVGSGGVYFAEHVVQSAYRPDISIKDVTVLALEAMAVAKKRDANTGGDTQFVRMFSNGRVTGVVPHDPAFTDARILLYQRHASELLMNIADGDLSDVEFQRRQVDFAQRVAMLRDDWRSAGQPYRDLFHALSNPTSSAMDHT